MSMQFGADQDPGRAPVGTQERVPEEPLTAPQRQPAVVTRGGSRHRLGELIWLCLLVVDAFLALDFLFRALALTRDGFTGIVERIGGALASPFAGLFGAGVPRVGHTDFWAALLALVVYSLAALVLLRLLDLVSRPLRRSASGA